MTFPPAILDGRAEWREMWRSIGPERRRRITSAVQAGRSLVTPEDAALAVGFARWKARRSWRSFGVLGAGNRSWRDAKERIEEANIKTALRALDRETP